jgi:hypothetical protein
VGFYELSEAERVTLTERAITERRTVIERWSVLEMAEAQPWSERAARAAAFLANCSAVADLGCGPMQLRSHLKPETRYVPIDVVARDQNTVVVDFNRQTLPALEVDGYAALGLLEYLFDVPNFLRQLSGILVASYNPVDLTSENRLAHAWVNAYSTVALESIFTDVGLQIVAKERLGSQILWVLQRAKANVRGEV